MINPKRRADSYAGFDRSEWSAQSLQRSMQSVLTYSQMQVSVAYY